MFTSNQPSGRFPNRPYASVRNTRTFRAHMLNSTELIRELVAIPGPPGREGPVREAVERHVAALGYKSTTDAKGNLLVHLPAQGKSTRSAAKSCRLVVTAHLDEIALMVTGIG